MEKIREILANVNRKDFIRYSVFSILFMITIVVISTLKFTEARYESNVSLDVAPTIAFFVVDVESQTGQIKLESMIPRDESYKYRFDVSNFTPTKHANVDLTYSIEITVTTNLPLDFKIYKGTNSNVDEIDHDTTSTDDNGVYYRHLVIDGASTMDYDDDVTDIYVLEVDFPMTSAVYPDVYAGIIELVDIRINAEQVV